MRIIASVACILAVFFLGSCSANSITTTENLPEVNHPTATWEMRTGTQKPSPTSRPTMAVINTNTLTPTEAVVTLTPNPFYTPTPYKAIIDEKMNPLTGLIVDNKANLFRRPVMVKISNYPREIRPQTGWSSADILFEYYLGEGMNRFLAVYYGENPEWAGPIRSGRLVDAQLGMMYESVLVYGGADARVDAVITDPDVLGDRAIDTRYTEICPPICGEDTHSLEGVFVDTAALSSYAFQQGFDEGQKQESLHLMQFSDQPLSFSKLGSDIWIKFSEVCKSHWFYDEATGVYFRWEESGDFEEAMVPSTDKIAEGRQLGFENIIVLFSDYIVYDFMLHDIAVTFEDDELPAMMWRDGLTHSGTWSANENHPLSVWNEDGTPYLFKPGRTWFVFISDDSSITQDDEGAWQVIFTRP